MTNNRYIVEKNTKTENKLQLPRFKNVFEVEGILGSAPFILFLFLLGLIYISNSHIAEKKVRLINKLTKELKELRWEYKSLKAELMYTTRESGIKEMMKNTGLKEMTTPPIIINKQVESKR